MDCLWGDDGLQFEETMSELWADIQVFNLTEIAFTGGMLTVDFAMNIISTVFTVLAFLITRGAEVLTAFVMLWYLLTLKDDWLVKAVERGLPTSSTKTHRSIVHQLTVIVEVRPRVSGSVRVFVPSFVPVCAWYV